MKLSESEQKIMEIVWRKNGAFLREILDEYSDPKPAKSTVATLLKRMQDKGIVDYKLFGNSRKYHALISKQDYFSDHLGRIVTNFFESSSLKFASFFAKSGKMSEEELKKLRDIVDDQIEKREK